MRRALTAIVIAVAVFLSVNSIVKAETLEQNTYRVYKKLVEANHIKNAPILFVVNRPVVNAAYYHYYNMIVIYKGIILRSTSDAQLAFVLGHELGHASKHRRPGTQWGEEYYADKKGKEYMLRAGYMCGGVGILKILKGGPGTDHPAGYDRWRRVRC